MDSIRAEKKVLRQRIKNLKASVSYDDITTRSLSVFSNIELDADFLSAKMIILYWSLKDEVFTHDFIHRWYITKSIYLPVIIGDKLEFRRFAGESRMQPDSKFGILEPTGELLTDLGIKDYAIIPGVAFDKNRHRLGRGRGFYDKILNQVCAKKVGICFDFQMVDKVPTESFDMPMDSVITEGSVY